MREIRKFWKDEEGIEFVEWALMCAAFALGCVALIPGLLKSMKTAYDNIGTGVTTTGTPAP